MTKDEALKLAQKRPQNCGTGYCSCIECVMGAAQEPVACVYKATTKKGETAHFGEYSSAKAWAGWGSVESVPLKTLTLISKSIKPCTTCEALARTVMLDQTSHDTQRQWVGLTDEEMTKIVTDSDVDWGDLLWKVVCLTKIIEAALKEKNR
jgi:hypothetical protein